MKWTEIIVNTTTEGTDLIADAFFSIGCTGVKVIDKNDILEVIHSEQMWDYIDESLLKNAPVVAKVSGFVAQEAEKEKLAELKEILSAYTCVGEIHTCEVNDDDWYENWKKYYAPIYSGRYIIVPKWISFDEVKDKTLIFIDPGLAFGTGQHESTNMCLRLMSNIDFCGKKVIDVGTGSGILGIAAVKSGAESCYMCDIDSVAVKAAKENAALNNISDKAFIEEADLLSKQIGQADVVCANLTADILIRLSKGLLPFLKDDGYLVCSGIIDSRLSEVEQVFATCGLALIEEVKMGEWRALLYKKAV